MTAPIRIAVTGAAGRISYALLFRIASGAMFGAHRPVELRLLDVPECLPLLDVTIQELVDCSYPLLASVRAGADAAEAFEHADWVFLLGSKPHRPGVKRADLLAANGPIFQEQGRALNEAAPTARVLVVANPCNTNCLIARAVARDVPAEHWFAMTRLDQNRAQALLAARAGVAVDHVNRMTVWGNHSESVFPDFHNAFLDDQPAPEVVRDDDWVHDVFEPTVAQRGRLLRAARGASPAGSAAKAILDTVRSLTTPTPVLHRFSAGVVSDGSYGVPRGLVFSFPLRTEEGTSWSIVPNLYLNAHAQARIAANVAELEYEASVVTPLLGRER